MSVLLHSILVSVHRAHRHVHPIHTPVPSDYFITKHRSIHFNSSLPRTERGIGDAQRTSSLGNPPHPALRGLLLGLGPQHQLFHRGVLLALILTGLQRGQVHAHAREVFDVPVQRGVRRQGHQLEHAAILGSLVVPVAHRVERIVEGVAPQDRVGREGHLEAAVGKVDAVGHLEEPLDGVEEERYELNRERIAGRRRRDNGVRSGGGHGTFDGRGGLWRDGVVGRRLGRSHFIGRRFIGGYGGADLARHSGQWRQRLGGYTLVLIKLFTGPGLRKRTCGVADD